MSTEILNRPGAGGRIPTGFGGKPDPEDARQLVEHPVSVRRIVALFAPHRARLIIVSMLIIASSTVGLATPFLTRELIDTAIPGRNLPMLGTLVGGLVMIAVLTSVFMVIQTWLSTVVGQKVMHGLRTSVFAHLQRLPLDFFTRTRGGEVQSRLTNDINGMQSVVTTTATSIATNVTMVIGTAIAMIALSWQLSLFSLIVLPPAMWITWKVSKMRRLSQSRAQRALADLQTQIEESLSVSGVQLSKTMGSGPQLASQFTDSSRRLIQFEVDAQIAGRWRMASVSMIFSAIPALIYLVAGLPTTGMALSIGTLVAFTALQAALLRPLMGVLTLTVQVTSALALFSRIFEYLDLPVAIEDPAQPEYLDPATARGEVRFEGISHSYADGSGLALAEVDLIIPSGSTLAIVGPTGAGKSTLAAMVSRLQDPTAGTVSIDGTDLRDLRLSNIAELVGVVSQDPYLLHASVADNLRYARPEASDAEIIAAARAAQVHDLINSLPEGYDTVVGARGYRFSGGEKQRIALARTILRDPAVLVLDEATSALDNSTERSVQQALDQLSAGRTTITIAHRLSTVQNADRIAVLDHGRITELGSHHELMDRNGRYAELVRAQDRQLLSA